MSSQTADRGPVGTVREWFAGNDLALILGMMALVYLVFAGAGIALGLPINGIVDTLRRVTFLAAIYAMLVLALNLQWGYAGLFNIGVAGFMAIAVYTMAMVTGPVNPAFGPPGLGLPLWIGIIAGMIAAALAGLVAALPALRLRADYLAIVTLALSEIIRITLNSSVFQTSIPQVKFFGITFLPELPVGTGGGQGMPIDLNTGTPIRDLFYQNPREPAPKPSALGESVFTFFGQYGIEQTVVVQGTYALILILFVVAFFWLLVRIGNSPFGRVLKAIREDETVAQSLGKDTRKFKIKVFVLGCALMGLAGILWITQRGRANPSIDTFMPITTFYVFLALIIGGSGSNTGSVLGGVVFAAFLFEGPPYVRRLVSNSVGSLDGAGNIADAFEALAVLDFEGFFGYVLTNLPAFQFMLLGVLIILLMQRRPEGLLGHRKEIAASIPLGRERGGEDE
jgi:ABC-type branched-subunit amino acid transport system permease subunit